MTVAITDTVGNTEGTAGMTFACASNSPRVWVFTPTKTRRFSMNEVRDMPAEELKSILLSSPARLVTDSTVNIIGDGLLQFCGGNVVTNDLALYAEEVTRAGVANEAGGDHGNIESSLVLDMPYPTYAVQKYSNKHIGVLFKVPEQWQIFDSSTARISKYRYYCPAILVYAVLNPAFDVMIVHLSMITQDSVNMNAVTVAHLPFPNIYTDSHVCTGQMRPEHGVAQAKSIGEACGRLVGMLFNSGWRLDLTPWEFPSNLDAIWKAVVPASREHKLTANGPVSRNYTETLKAMLEIMATPAGTAALCERGVFSRTAKLSDILKSQDTSFGQRMV